MKENLLQFLKYPNKPHLTVHLRDFNQDPNCFFNDKLNSKIILMN